MGCAFASFGASERRAGHPHISWHRQEAPLGLARVRIASRRGVKRRFPGGEGRYRLLTLFSSLLAHQIVPLYTSINIKYSPIIIITPPSPITLRQAKLSSKMSTGIKAQGKVVAKVRVV